MTHSRQIEKKERGIGTDKNYGYPAKISQTAVDLNCKQFKIILPV